MNVSELTAVSKHFIEYKQYTREPTGSKAWFNFWKQERERCLKGYSFGSDYVSGYEYFYLNYSPILKTEVIHENIGGQNQADRIIGFPDYWDGDTEFFNYIDDAEKSGKHALLLGSRGKGKSLKAGSMCVRNYHHIANSKSYCFAATEGYLNDDGIINKAWDTMDFVDINTPWGKRRQVENSSLHKRASVKQTSSNGVETEVGFKSEIMGVTVGDNINKLRGKRGKLIILEEFGNFPKGKTGWNILRPSMEQGQDTFGLILAIGTGGTEGASFEAMEELFYNPKSYKVYAVPNIWDEGMENTECAFFYPAWKNYSGAYNKITGESDKALALSLIEVDRKLVAGANDPHALTRRKAEIPNTPKEAMMRITGSKFPIADLSAHLAEVEMNPHRYKNADYIGKFIINKEGIVEWKLDSEVEPIYQFPHKDNKMKGGVIIWEHPYKTNDGATPYGMYIAGIDSYDHDESSTLSLGSCWVMNVMTGRLVAEYTGRPSAEEFYETTRRLLIYYNAIANPENHNKGILDYFDRKNSTYLFCEQPRIVTDINQKSTVNRKRGTPPTMEINSYGRTQISDWLSAPAPGQEEDAKEVVLNLHKIRSITLLKELIYWNMDGNFDRVSALGMLFILLKDREKIMIDMESTKKINTQDTFFSRKWMKQRNSPFKPSLNLR